MIFDIENSFWKSNFSTLEQAGKAFQDSYNPGLYRVFKLELHQNKHLLGHQKYTFKP